MMGGKSSKIELRYVRHGTVLRAMITSNLVQGTDYLLNVMWKAVCKRLYATFVYAKRLSKKMESEI